MTIYIYIYGINAYLRDTNLGFDSGTPASWTQKFCYPRLYIYMFLKKSKHIKMRFKLTHLT